MSKFFINRPIVAMVISIIMVIVGLVTLVGLPVAQFPKVVPPEIFIQANYVGADAQTIEQSVAKPNMTVPEIINAVSSQNTVNPAGKIGGRPAPPGQQFTYAVRAQGRLTSEQEFGDIVL